ncbi:MAG: MOSC domain-containing protein [Halomonadaceae bacterium]|nr:MAG: MOSC domain-containing protein [Halomonadaceae bacterium]
MSSIVAIYTAPASRAPMSAQQAVQVRMGSGIVGDRHYRPNAQGRINDATQVTLIAREAITVFNQAHGLTIPPDAFRRNLLTTGVDLNGLVGCDFRVGKVLLRGMELCEPCGVLGKLLQQPDLSPAAVIRALVGQGGLRAQILDTGVIHVGDAVVAL